MSSPIIKHVTFTSSYFSYADEQTTKLLLRARLCLFPAVYTG